VSRGSGPARLPAAAAPPALEARGLCRRFRNGRGAGPVDLMVHPGEVVALLGPNGSGKSTLLRCLATLTRPSAGSVAWWGDRDRTRARARLGVGFDVSAHVEEASGLQNLAFFAAHQGTGSGVDRSRLEAVLAGHDLLAVADDPVATYSFGMRRRLLLAEALCHDPDLILLDEPTVGLDVTAAHRLAAGLRQRAGAGAAVCLASNDTGFVERTADRVGFLDQGQMVRDAPVATLLAELGTLRELRLRCVGAAPIDRLRRLAGVATVAATPDGVVLTAHPRDGLVADVVQALGDADRVLQDLQIRDPDLSDCFLALVGRPLEV